jgi:hypothetical protein
MIYKGVEYELELIEPGLWKWQCRIGEKTKTGKTKCSLELLANRRVQVTIDRLLRPPRGRSHNSRSDTMASVLHDQRGKRARR